MDKVSLLEIAGKIKKPWTPVEVARIDNYVVRMAIFEGQYKLHKHDDYDEFFLVIQGNIQIKVEDKINTLALNEGLKVPKGISHQPSAEKPAIVLMFENKDL
jgi:mannose-6-phosphate isomerase-like protein (cupin superfamily)